MKLLSELYFLFLTLMSTFVVYLCIDTTNKYSVQLLAVWVGMLLISIASLVFYAYLSSNFHGENSHDVELFDS